MKENSVQNHQEIITAKPQPHGKLRAVLVHSLFTEPQSDLYINYLNDMKKSLSVIFSAEECGPLVVFLNDNVLFSEDPSISSESNLLDYENPDIKNKELRRLDSLISLMHIAAGELILVLPGISPFLDPKLTLDLIAHHRRFLADFTLSENIPFGFCGDVITSEMADLLKLTQLKESEGKSLREFFLSKMNDYDVELFYVLPDLRQYRSDFTLNSERSRAVVNNFREVDLNYERFSQFIHKYPYYLRPAVSYLEIELTDFSKLDPVYIPKRKPPVDSAYYLTIDHLKTIFEWTEKHTLNGDLTVCLGGLGDSYYHPELYNVLHYFLSSGKVTRVYLETFGIDLDDESVTRLLKLPNPEKLHIIIRLTTLKKERYTQIYNTDLSDHVLANAEIFKKNKYPFTVHCEMIRMTDVADEITEYFDYFKDSYVNVLISKYNRYIRMLPERRVSDLTPMHRDFCWHLSRDLYITSSGKIPVCRQDPFAENTESLSLIEDGLQAAFLKIEKFHNHSVRGDHASVPMNCLKCDEWYTFNG
jgi:spiro-SPASM protein